LKSLSYRNYNNS